MPMRTNHRFWDRTAGRAAACVIAMSACGGGATAIITVGGEPTELPPAGFVGSWGGSSAVPIGPNWVITAKHVGGDVGNNFSMRGVDYRAVEVHRHPTQDIMLIRVAEILPGFHRLASDVVVGDPVMLGGCGVTQGTPTANGYNWDGPREEAWGANTLEGGGVLLAVRFDGPDHPAHVPDESIFAINDSGAGLFVFAADGELELAGLAIAVTGWGASNYGATAFARSLDDLREWIMPLVDPDAPLVSSVVAPRE